MDRYAGFEIITNPYIPKTEPKMKLSEDIDVSPAFRWAFNKWLLDFFGEKPVVYVLKDRNIMTMHPETAILYKEQMNG